MKKPLLEGGLLFRKTVVSLVALCSVGNVFVICLLLAFFAAEGMLSHIILYCHKLDLYALFCLYLWSDVSVLHVMNLIMLNVEFAKRQNILKYLHLFFFRIIHF